MEAIFCMIYLQNMSRIFQLFGNLCGKESSLWLFSEQIGHEKR